MTPRRVAVIDDDPEILRLAATLLERAGHRPVVSDGCFDRLAFLAEHAPHLLLLDVNMPGQAGDDFYELLRDDPRLEHVRVAFLSSNDEADLRRLVRRTGAAGFIPKSALGIDFAARVERLLRAA